VAAVSGTILYGTVRTVSSLTWPYAHNQVAACQLAQGKTDICTWSASGGGPNGRPARGVRTRAGNWNSVGAGRKAIQRHSEARADWISPGHFRG